MNAIAEETEIQPEPQAPEEQPSDLQVEQSPPRTLSETREALASELKRFKSYLGELESNEKRLAEADSQEAELLDAVELAEEEQVEKLSKTLARKKVLERRLEHKRNGIQSAQALLGAALQEAFDAFGRDLHQLRLSREQRYLDHLKSLVSTERWPWTEKHAVLFIANTSDLWPISVLGIQAESLRGSRAVALAAKQLLDHIAVLEAEKAKEPR